MLLINIGLGNDHKDTLGSVDKTDTRHAYAWQIGPFWQDTLDMYMQYIPRNVTPVLLCFVFIVFLYMCHRSLISCDSFSHIPQGCTSGDRMVI